MAGNNFDASAQQAQVSTILKALYDPRATNRQVLQVQISEAQRMRNGGYPKHLYHETLDPVVVTNDQQAQSLNALGYVEHYIVRHFPKAKYRRNMSPKYSGFDSKGNVLPELLPYVESTIVRTVDDERALMSRRQPPGCSAWADSPGDLDPLPEESDEDPALAISKLEGQLEEARRVAQVAQQPQGKR